MKIEDISAREILDSRGNPTVAASVMLSDGSYAESRVPSGASTGSAEAYELRDNDASRYDGQGVLLAVRNIEKIIGPMLIGVDAESQREVDQKMLDIDGTPNKKKLGANAILAVSMAVAKAAATSTGLELFEYLSKIFGKKGKLFKLPTPMFNILNGGRHAENNVDIQETMIVPVGYRNFSKKLEVGSEVYRRLKKELRDHQYSVGLGDEGGFAPDFSSNEDVFEFVLKAIQLSGLDPEKIRISSDIAATELYDPKSKTYHLFGERKKISPDQFMVKINSWAKKYQLLSVEDGLAENDPNWPKLTKKLEPTITIGDDLFTTNPEKIRLGIGEKQAGGVIIKPNQIGTVTETLEAIKTAQEGRLKIIVSHRSGETEDTFIADLAVATGAEFIKSGAPARSERLAKYNRLLSIEEKLAKNSHK